MNINKEKMTDYLEKRISRINHWMDRYPDHSGNEYFEAKVDAFREVLRVMDSMEESAMDSMEESVE